MYPVNYYLTAGLSIFFLIGCLLHLKENDIFSVKTIKKFKRLIYVMMFEIGLDALFILLEGRDVEHYLLYLMKSIELFLNPIIAFLVFSIFFSRETCKHDLIARRLRNILFTIIGLDGVLMLLVFFDWRIFYISKDNIYHRGVLMPAYIVLLITVILVLVYGILKFSSTTQSTMRWTLASFTMILNIGILIKDIFPETDYDFLCMSVAVPFLLIYYSHVTLRVDPLTQLLNRQVYTQMCKKVDYMTTVFMIDANCFKEINDTHGHPCGDRIMQLLARDIKDVYGKHGYCFRFGGDEFCVILKPNVFETLLDKTPHYDPRLMADGLMKSLNELIRARIEYNVEDYKYLVNGVSQGAAVYDPKEGKPFEEIVEKADQNMYIDKEQSKH